MKRPKTNTRGRRSGDDRIYGSTINNAEVDAETIGELISSAGFDLSNEVLRQITAQVNIRVAEVSTPYLTWGETRNAAIKLAEGLQNVQEALEQLASLGVNDVGRPLGDHLLGDLQYEARRNGLGEKTHWWDCVTFLRHMSENLEDNFVDPGGRAAPRYEFIRWVRSLLPDQQQRGEMKKFVKLLEVLDEEFPGIVFPENTVPSSRRDYVNNALR